MTIVRKTDFQSTAREDENVCFFNRKFDKLICVLFNILPTVTVSHNNIVFFFFFYYSLIKFLLYIFLFYYFSLNYTYLDKFNTQKNFLSIIYIKRCDP